MQAIYKFSSEIKCPKCGHVAERANNFVYTTYPPCYKYHCPNCDSYFWSTPGEPGPSCEINLNQKVGDK